MYQQFPILGTFESGNRPTANGGTAFTWLIQPWMGGPGRSRGLFQAQTSPKNLGRGVAHVEKVVYTTQATAHLIGFLRPLNFTYFKVALAKQTTAIPDTTLFDDPGVYSTNYKYDGTLSTGTAAVADNAIAAGDYVVYQLDDGTWQLDTIASGTFGSSLTLTTGTPNVTGGGCAAGSPFYFFGVVTDKDPATGHTPPQTNIAANQGGAVWGSGMYGVCSALHPGDPLIFYSPNTTTAGFLEYLCGYYAAF